MEDIENFLKKIGVGQRPMKDPFFDNSYKTCKVFERKGVIAEDEEELCHKFMKEFLCNACDATFENLLDYELHYHNTHHFVCFQCKKWKPTAKLLEMHIQEMHDNFFKLQAEKQPMYRCYVSECNVKFMKPQERTQHCREVHKYPKNYRFDEFIYKKETGKGDSAMEVDEKVTPKKKNLKKIHFGKNAKSKAFGKQCLDAKGPVDIKTNDSSSTPSVSLKSTTMFIPRQVQQKSYAKLLTQNQKLEKNVLETESIMELSESLPNL
ncbi:PREDICTED: protein lethal(2)k10201 [Ceratosolen solmsi marchali]|uniref:Protein lethal(2)k10201 n=1 Tax=Ceratosolen solmsi marchali TaxID=326594 RepID=A0AAJ7DWN1_9HYME|nr:PREDICTED: protein lethal(2)k10201 [Ceratosolen solmsi marchali]